MDDPIEQIKDRVSIADLVERAGLTVVGHGRRRRTEEHPSLSLYLDENSWYWFSQGRGGGVFDWWMDQHGCDFGTALGELARMAGVTLRPLTPERQAAIDQERAGRQVLELATGVYHRALINHPQARAGRDYCNARGWKAATIVACRLGFVLPIGATARNEAPLSAKLHDAGLLEHPLAKAVLSIPPESLVYPHLVGGQVVYLSARSVAGKRHYNLPAELAGPKRLFRAEPIDPSTAAPSAAAAASAQGASAQDDKRRRQEAVKKGTGVTVLCEGQADAISLAQWGFRAVALCGVDAAGLRQEAGRLGISHVGLDNDEAGQAKALAVAWALDPLLKVVTWAMPARTGTDEHGRGVKDANDLLRAGATAEEVGGLLDAGEPALLLRARLCRSREQEVRNAHVAAIGSAWRNLDELTAADLAPEIAKAMGVPLSQFKRLMAAAGERAKAEEQAEEQASPETYENSAGGAVGDVVFEQCVSWDASGTPVCRYAVRLPGGEIKLQNTVDAGGTTYIPFPATINLIRKRVVLFPSEPVEYGSQRELLAEIRAFIHRWLDVDPFYEQLASYYVMFTWLYDLFETLPYLRAIGDYGTGKSRFLQAIGVLCYRPMFVSGASTSSPIFRVIDMFRGTLIVDEADFAKSDAAVEIVKIINVGYAKGGVVLRAEKDENSDTYYPSASDVFGPKILATRRLFEDRATESRCLTKRMSTARPRPDISRLVTRKFWADAEAIRNKLLMYRLRAHRPVEVDPALSDFSIEPRLDQVTLALKSIIADEGMREQISTFVRAYNSTLISDRQMSVPAVVVQVLAETWYRPERTLQGEVRDWSMKGLAERVKTLLETIDPDEKMNPRRLSSILSEDLGLTRREQDPETRRATLFIDEAALHALMSRYGVDEPA